MIEATGGPEVWLLNATTGDSRVMTMGQQLEQVRFDGTRGDAARFRLGEEIFVVAIGQHLNQRTPVEGD